MKKLFSTSILFVTLNFLTGCVNHRRNFFVEGIYNGVNSYNSSETCRLIVSKIDKDEYILRNGKNVVKDVVKNDYFLLSFYAYDESGSEKVIDLINLTDAHNGSKGAPVTYVDENFIYVKPLSTDDEDNLDSAYYVIESNCELKQQHFYFKLFISEDDYL